jgi:hypothetical protein
LRTIVSHHFSHTKPCWYKIDHHEFTHALHTKLMAFHLSQMVTMEWMLGNAQIVRTRRLSTTRQSHWFSWTTFHRSLWSWLHVCSTPTASLAWWIHATPQLEIDGPISLQLITTR